MTIVFSPTLVAQRLVRYRDLRPCTTAFVDTRTPGSEQKENFTIIGPGVAENPDQHVHIDIPHGFNIGGARQPPHCVNSQHSHETAEVFVVHSGTWRFKSGHDGSDGYVDIGPGDTISIPTNVFRGFENIGEDSGFLFAVLGGDDPGNVTWAPYVFDAAAQHGLVLLEGGRLIDTTREAVPTNANRMRPTSRADVARFTRYDSESLAKIVAKAAELKPGGGLTTVSGFQECPIVGVANAAENMPAGTLSWPHSFQIRALRIAPGARSPLHSRTEVEVLFVQSGALRIDFDGGGLDLEPGDTFTMPIGMAHAFANLGREQAVVYVVRGGDHPQAPHWASTMGRER